MKEQPKFIKDFSKQESPDERTQLAQEVREKRKSHFDDKKEIEGKEQEKSEVLKQIEVLRDQIESYNDASFFVKVKDFFTIKKMENDLRAHLGKQYSIEEDLSKAISGRPDLEETRAMIADFYTKEKKKWAESPYSKEDIAKNFTEENLASLSTEDYALLMRRFPGQMVSHVTRQGIRDHIAMYEHTKGAGEEHNGFKSMLESKRLRSPLAVAMSQAQSYHDICKFLNGGKEIITNRDSIGNLDKQPTSLRLLIDRLRNYTDKVRDFNDKTAIHFAVGTVADSIYGGENGNEIFISYPSAFIASKYYFNNFENDVINTPDPSNHNHNDLYVWAKNEEDGMNIDAGIVFLPENAKVDSKTGSQFEMDFSGKPIEKDGVLKKTENAINSKDYWEKYFSKYPESRPSKIVYYDASMSPTEALLDWKIKSGIIDKRAAGALGFDENAISADLERPGVGNALVRFHQLALNALEYEYGGAEVLHAFDQDFFTRPQEEWQKRIDKIYKKTAA